MNRTPMMTGIATSFRNTSLLPIPSFKPTMLPKTSTKGPRQDGSQRGYDAIGNDHAVKLSFGQGRYPTRLRTPTHRQGEPGSPIAQSHPARKTKRRSPNIKRTTKVRRRKVRVQKSKQLRAPHTKRTGSTVQSTPAEPTKTKCAACFSNPPLDYVARLSCEHTYCSECVGNVFNVAINDEALFPPRCHICAVSISTPAVMKLLTRRVVRLFKDKEVEYATPPANRIYCHVPECSAFIPATKVTDGGAVVCPKCGHETCKTCKGHIHKGEDCPQDEDVQKTLALSALKGWKRCPSCRTMVERASGCSHICRIAPPLSRSFSNPT